jgi:hypothetical protein
MSIHTIIISFFLEPISYFLIFCALLTNSRLESWKRRHIVLIILHIIGVTLLVRSFFVSPNNYLYGYLYLVTGICFSLYFFFLYESYPNRWLTLLYGLMVIFYYFFERFFVTGEKLFPSIGFVITSSGIVIMIFIYFFLLITHVNEKSLLLNVDFWFVCSQLVYHLGAFGVFLTYNKLTVDIIATGNYSAENRELLTSLWGAHNILLFIGSLIFWTGVLWIFYQTKSYNRNQTNPGKNLY